MCFAPKPKHPKKIDYEELQKIIQDEIFKKFHIIPDQYKIELVETGVYDIHTIEFSFVKSEEEPFRNLFTNRNPVDFINMVSDLCKYIEGSDEFLLSKLEKLV